LRARADQNVLADLRMTIAGLLAGATEGLQYNMKWILSEKKVPVFAISERVVVVVGGGWGGIVIFIVLM
jgi:hypothetical protein